ncbi:MAG: hypothetical protein RIC07_10570 [Coleofasciculus sp. E1-EBD-02]
MRDRINAFATVVGNLQPILAQVPTFIEQAAISADPEEEDVLMSEFEQVLNTPPLRPALEDMIAMDVEADLQDIRQPIPPTPITPETIEQLFTTSARLKSDGVEFEPLRDRIPLFNWRFLGSIQRVQSKGLGVGRWSAIARPVTRTLYFRRLAL